MTGARICILTGVFLVAGVILANVARNAHARAAAHDQGSSGYRSGGGQSATSSQADSKRPSRGSIDGRLVDGAGQPLPNATVFVRKIGAFPVANRATGTDSEGRFRADDLSAGVYSVSAYVPGYVAESDGVQPYHRLGETVALRVVKGAAISGVVTNSAGEPVIGARMNAIRVRDAEGRPIRGAGASGNSRQTDDRGAYRLYGLQAGSYLVAVNGGGSSYFPSTAYDSDAPTYYPSTTRDAAAEVTVRLGDDIGGVDIRYRGERGHIVSGTVSGTTKAASDFRSVWVALSHLSSGAVEASAYISSRGDGGFALYGVPDGDYEILGSFEIGSETGAASAPRRVTVKGADVTGLNLVLAPLGSMAGKVVLETLSQTERISDCKAKKGSLVDDVLIAAIRDSAEKPRVQPGPGPQSRVEVTPDDKGEFRINGLTAARYRFELRLPNENWFVRSITAPDRIASRPPVDLVSSGTTVGAGKRVGDLTVVLAEGAAGIRGRVVPAAATAAIPPRLRVHMVPAEPESADAAARYYEVLADGDGGYSFSNVAPGKYLILARPLSDEEFMETTLRPVAWDPAGRRSLRTAGLAEKTVVELQQCQRVTDHRLTYAPAAPANTVRKQ